MTDQPKTLTTTETMEYIRVHTGRTTAPNRTQLNKWHHAPGGIQPHTHGGKHYAHQNTYLLSDVQDLCEKINDGYWRKLRWQKWRETQGESS